MTKHILITGGAGFIGSHLADQLLAAGHRVRILDNLSSQVHGSRLRRPDYLNRDVDLIVGDVRDAATVSKALRGVDQVCHLAAVVGVQQSMYHVDTYTSVNDYGMAVLLQALIATPVERLVVASSMSIYGEGHYQNERGEPVETGSRSLQQLMAKDWEVRDARGRMLTPVPTPESKRPCFGSVYALSKYDQERMSLIVGQAYRIPTIALRLFNVFGPRQAMSNPYSGVLTIFATRLLNGDRPLIFEDGGQRRDFVSVHDVARACQLALGAEAVSSAVLNIGSGQSFTVRELAERMARVLGCSPEVELTEKYRVGDIRHCFADISAARQVLGYAPTVEFDAGLRELAEWLGHEGPKDVVPQARVELLQRGLST